MSNLMYWIVRACWILVSMAILLANFDSILSHGGFELSINPKFLICVLYLGLFAFYAVSIVLYKVFTFNNCQAASEELRKVCMHT